MSNPTRPISADMYGFVAHRFYLHPQLVAKVAPPPGSPATQDLTPSHQYEGHVHWEESRGLFHVRLHLEWDRFRREVEVRIGEGAAYRAHLPHPGADLLGAPERAILLAGMQADHDHRAVCIGGPWDGSRLRMGWADPVGHRLSDHIAKGTKEAVRRCQEAWKGMAMPMAITLKAYRLDKAEDDEPCLRWDNVGRYGDIEIIDTTLPWRWDA